MKTDVADPAMASAPADRPNPYVGPRSFRIGETLYGRTREIHELRDALVAERIVLLYSPSGAGKTSLLEAGLRPELADRDFVVLPTIRVGHEVAPSLGDVRNRYVVSTVLSLEEGRPSDARLSDAEVATIELGAYLAMLGSELPEGLDPCLVFDQFEELFTLDPTDLDQKAEFMRELGVALRDRSRWALFSMREDFIAQLDPYLALVPKRLGYRYRLDLLGVSAALAAARRPAAEAGVDFAEAAASQLVDDLRRVRVQRGATVSDELGPYVEPVQLQVVCRQLWATLAPGATSIETADVAGLGNIDEALAEFYVGELRAVSERTGVSERELRAWFDEQLITEQGFRTQVHQGPGGSRAPEVLRQLEDAHLIRADRRRGTDWYEIAHDRLVAPIRASNEAWRTAHLSPLQLEAQLWDRSDRKGPLMTGDVLAEAQGWAADHPEQLLDVDRDYLEACSTEQRRAERERRASRRNKVLALVASVVGVIALVAGVIAWQTAREADRQKVAARDQRDLATQREQEAIQARNDQERLGATAAWTSAGVGGAELSTQLLAPLYAHEAAGAGAADRPARELATARHYLAHDPIAASSAAALTRDGAHLVRGTEGGRIELVDVVSQQRTPITTVDGAVAHLDTSDVDDRFVAVSVGDEPPLGIRVWDLAGGGEALQLDDPGDGMVPIGFAFSQSPGLIAASLYAAANEPTGIAIWDAATGERLAAPGVDEVAAASVALSSDGQRLAAIDDQQTLRVWGRSGETWQDVTPLAVQAAGASPLAFDATGDRLAFVGADDRPRVVSVSSRTAAVLEGSGSFPGGSDLVFLADGRLRGLGLGGEVDVWSEDDTGAWVLGAGAAESFAVFLPPSFNARLSADGSRAVLLDAGFSVYDASTGLQLLGEDVVWGGTTGSGRAAALVGPASFEVGPVVDRTAGEPWSPASDVLSARAVGFSPDGGQFLALDVDGELVDLPERSVIDVPCEQAQDVDRNRVAVVDGGTAMAVLGGQGYCAWQPGTAVQLFIGAESNQYFGDVALSPSGEFLAAGSSWNEGGLVEVRDLGGNSLEVMDLPGLVTAVAVDDTGFVAAGDINGNVVVGQTRDLSSPIALPAVEEVMAVNLSRIEGDERYVAVATLRSVYVYKLTQVPGIDAWLNPELVGGFDLYRGEGHVLDLSFTDGDPNRLVVLHSDLFVDEYDPLARAGDMAAEVRRLAGDAGLLLTDDECQALVQRPCPTG